MIFLTIGTTHLFDRLVRAVDEVVSNKMIDEEIFGQVGKGGYRPKHFESTEILDKIQFDQYFRQSNMIISHAGMGSITMALNLLKPILVVPRLKKYNEIVNDHQTTTAKKFEQLGHVVALYQLKDLPSKIQVLKSFHPVPRVHQADQVARYIGRFISDKFT
jgi:UDP-N-acetylglucosamine transferase subunit ALG13